MNKIYKVVWSKVKHCYVVTSELAKRNGKGCGARSLRMAAVSLGVAAALLCSGAVLPIFGESVAEAASSYKISGTVEKDGVTKSFTEANFVESSGSQRDYGYGNQFFESGEATNAQNYHTTITSAPNWRMFVGAGIDVGTVSGNTVTVNGDSTNITQSVIGGYAIGSATKTDESLVTQNEVIINAGTYYDVYGATMGMYFAAPGKATDNTVTINGGMVKGYVWGGDGDVSDSNKVYIKGGTVKPINTGKKVFGGSGVKEATNNEVYISGGTVGTEKENAANGYTGDISGGYSWSGKADGNKISVTGGTVHAILYGGKNSTESVRNDYSAVGGDSPVEHTTLTGTVSNNEVQISGGTVNGNVYGGMGAVSARGNTVTVKDNAKLGSDVSIYGGTAMAKYSTSTYTWSEASGFEVNTSVDKVEYGDVTNNTVNIGNFINSSANDDIYVYGGMVGGNDDATSTKKVNVSNNTVTVDANNGTLSNVYGGGIEGKANGDVKENKVEIKSGTVYGVIGGLTTVGDATGNSVSVIDGDVKFYYGEILGGSSENGDAIDNTVTISGGNLVNNNGVSIKGGTASGKDNNAKKNKVIISNGTIGSDEGSASDSYSKVVGGYGDGCNATDNTVTIAGGKFTGQIVFKLYGGESYTAPSTGTAGETFAATSAANDNTLDISGGTYSKDVEVYGGWTMAQPWAYAGTAIATVTADKNTVTISGGTYSGNADVYGGYVFARPSAYGTEATATAEGTASNNTVEISGGTFSGKVNVYGGYGKSATAGTGTLTVKTTIINNNVFIKKGTLNGDVYGGFSSSTGTNNVDGNTVSISKDATIGGNVYGGAITGKVIGDVKGNIVEVTGGTINEGKYVYGGYSVSNSVGGSEDGEGNKVIVSGGEVKSTVLGGFSSTAAAMGNSVEVSGEGKVSASVYGGYSSSGTAGGDGTNDGNKVIVSGGEVQGAVTGGYSNTAAAKGNSVEISGGKVGLNADAVSYIYGGFSNQAAATGNKVSISNGTAGEKRSVNIFGGYSGSGAADTNEVSITGGTVGNVNSGSYASDIYGGRGQTSASGNTVSIEGGTLKSSVYGGYSNGGADGNIINKIGGTVTGWIYGGRGGTSASQNKITISGGDGGYVHGGSGLFNSSTVNQNEVTVKGKNTVVNNVYGGSNGAEINGNKVLIEESTVNNLVYGGNSDSTGTVKNNEVAISDATVKGNVFGGASHKGLISKNTVTIINSTIGGNVFGGDQFDRESGTDYTVAGNIVTVNGGTFTADKKIYGGFTYSGSTTDNIINLTGSTTGLEGVEVYGGSQSTNTGNELHVGGTKTYDGSGNLVTSVGDAWQGSSDNTVKTVANFETIALHSVAWNPDVAALAATTVDNIGTLDIKDMQFDKTPSNGESMALLKAENDLGVVGIGLAYKDGSTEKTATSAELAAGVTFDSGALTDTAVNGVSVTGTQDKKVSLENSNKEIRYSFSSTITGITIATNTYTADGTARTFGKRDNLTGATYTNNLAFSDESKKNMASGQSMVILDATEAVAVGGATLPALTATYKEIFNDAISGKVVTLSGTHTDTLALNSDSTKLVYSVGNKEVSDAVFDGKVDFAKDSKYYEADAQYKFNGTTEVNADKLAFNETTEALVKGNKMTLLSADGLSANVTKQPTNADIAVNYTDAQGIKMTATATGEVKAASNAVDYEVTGVTMKSVDLAGWDGENASEVPTGWTLATDATVETDGMTTPTVEAGKVDIITSSTEGYFAGAIINGENKYQESSFDETDKGIKFKVKQEKGVKADGKNLVYAAGAKNVDTATMSGEIKWDTENAYYKNTKYAFSDSSKTDISAVKFTADTDPLDQSMILIQNSVAGTVTEGTPEFTMNLSNTSLSATAKGEAKVAEGNLTYKVTDVELQSVTVNGVGSASDTVPEGWKAASGLTVDTSDMELPGVMPAAGEETVILKGSDKITFSDENISDSDNKYGKNPDRFTEEDETQGKVVIAGKQDKGVAANAEGSLVYKVGTKDVDSVSLGTVQWESSATLLDASDKKVYNFAGVTALAGNFEMNYEKPEDVAAKQSMTLLKANETLKDIAKEETNTYQYTKEPVAGVTVKGAITGKLAAKDKAVTFTVDSNKATDLIFKKVEWKTEGALLDHKETLKNVSFDGAKVDTSEIDFYKEMYIEADQTMTLVSGFDGEANITPESTKYTVGTAYEGESETKLEGGNLIIRTTTAAGLSEQTHKTVMAMEAGVALLAGGNEHVGKVLEGLGDCANQGSDGTSVAVSIGGNGSRYETGSHVNTNSWNAVLAIGAKRDLEQGALEYGVFGEYGKGNYKLYNDDGGRGDGDAHYAGGGLMAKWTNKHDVYTEASFRLGRMSDSADNILEGGGNKYGYDVHASYYGAHVGLGKIFNYKGGKSLDVYGKFFYTKRDGVEYDAKQHYNLDSVSSSVLRIGARYGSNDKKWNWYGGLAYEYEFDGESKGTVNGTEIRAASIKGSSVRGEFGMKMIATKDNPWQADISIYGYGGKHRGFGGSVNVAYTF